MMNENDRSRRVLRLTSPLRSLHQPLLRLAKPDEVKTPKTPLLAYHVSAQCNFRLDRSAVDPVVVLIFESATSTVEPLASAELMASCGAGWEVHDEISFLNETIENCFRFLQAALCLELSKTLLARLAQLYLAAPFGLEDLRGCDTAGRIGVKD